MEEQNTQQQHQPQTTSILNMKSRSLQQHKKIQSQNNNNHIIYQTKVQQSKGYMRNAFNGMNTDKLGKNIQAYKSLMTNKQVQIHAKTPKLLTSQTQNPSDKLPPTVQSYEKSKQDFNYLDTFLFFLRKKNPHSNSIKNQILKATRIDPANEKKVSNLSPYKALLLSDYLQQIAQKYSTEKLQKIKEKSHKNYSSLIAERNHPKLDTHIQTAPIEEGQSVPNRFLIQSNQACFLDGRGRINQTLSPLNVNDEQLMTRFKGVKRGMNQNDKWKPLWMCSKQRIIISNPQKYHHILDQMPQAHSAQTIPLLTQSQLRDFQSQLEIDRNEQAKAQERKYRSVVGMRTHARYENLHDSNANIATQSHNNSIDSIQMHSPQKQERPSTQFNHMRSKHRQTTDFHDKPLTYDYIDENDPEFKTLQSKYATKS